MKKCICLFGQYRNIEMSNYINTHFPEYDVFIHTFSEKEPSDFKNITRLLKMDHEPTRIFDERDNTHTMFGKTFPNNIKSMFFSMKRVIENKLYHEHVNNEKYDVVILQRCDLKFEELNLDRLDFEKMNFNDNSYDGIYANMFINDHFCISKSENIDRLSTVFENVEDYAIQTYCVAECILRKHIDIIDIQYSQSFFKYIIKRDVGDWRPDFRMNI